MTLTLDERLNKIIAKITSKDFLEGKGLGNEIGFWIFDYPPEREIDVRTFFDDTICPALLKREPPVRVGTVHLLTLVTEILQSRGILDSVLEMQKNKGDEATLAELHSVLQEDKLAQNIATKFDIAQLDLLVLTGVGTVFPILRTHTLLSALQPRMGNTPLLMFFPGKYDGHSLRLFNVLADDHYYRAFRLIPEAT